MAGSALRQDVLAVERIFSITGMVEDQRLPTLVCVTGRTLVAETRFVLVVFFMTSDTRRGGVFEGGVLVAGLARHIPMSTGQGKLGLAVIEAHLLPIALHVAVFAEVAETAFVFVVFLVACIAIRGRISVLGFGFVTGLAFNLLRVGMGALEREVRLFVIEGLLRNRSDILRSSLVICVAFLAFALLLESPVRSLLLLDVLTNVFVTILAERILCRLIEPLVTFCAVFFPFRMTFDHLPRHQRRLDVVCPGRCGHEHQCAE